MPDRKSFGTCSPKVVGDFGLFSAPVWCILRKTVLFSLILYKKFMIPEYSLPFEKEMFLISRREFKIRQK